LTGDEQTEVVRRRLRRWERAWLALQAQVAADFRLLATAVRAMARCDSAGLTGVEARAVVMASVHENAARLGLDERVELGEHLTALCLDVQRHFGGAGGALVTCDFQRTFAPVETAARCALVVGEVLACALAAPPADSGATAVTLGLSQLNGLVSMRLSATRIGTTPVAAPRIELIRAVVERTGGIVDVGGGAHGVTLVVQFPSEVCA
jgi:two-component sensor histidine kinase